MNKKSTSIVIRDAATGLKIELLSATQGYRFVSLKLSSMSKRLPQWRKGLYARIIRANNMHGCRPKKAAVEAVALQFVELEETETIPREVTEHVVLKHTVRKSPPSVCIQIYGYKGHRPSKGKPRVIDQRKLTRQELALLVNAIRKFECSDVEKAVLATAKQKALKYLGA